MKIRKILDSFHYNIMKAGLKFFSKNFSDNHIDQFGTYVIDGKYGKIYLRFDRSLPDSEIKYATKL